MLEQYFVKPATIDRVRGSSARPDQMDERAADLDGASRQPVVRC